MNRQVQPGLEACQESAEAWRCDADNGHQSIGELDGFADDFRVTTEVIFPEAIAEHDGPACRRSAANIVGGGNQTADLRFDPEHLKGVPAHEVRVMETLGSVVVFHGGSFADPPRDAHE